MTIQEFPRTPTVSRCDGDRRKHALGIGGCDPSGFADQRVRGHAPSRVATGWQHVHYLAAGNSTFRFAMW